MRGVCPRAHSYKHLLYLLKQTLMVINKKLKCGIHNLHGILLQRVWSKGQGEKGCGQRGAG